MASKHVNAMDWALGPREGGRRTRELGQHGEASRGAARAGTVELRIPSCVREATSKSSWRHASWPKRPWRAAVVQEAQRARACRPPGSSRLVRPQGALFLRWLTGRHVGVFGACLRSIVRYIDIEVVLGQFVFVTSWKLLLSANQGAAARRIVVERNGLGSQKV